MTQLTFPLTEVVPGRKTPVRVAAFLILLLSVAQGFGQAAFQFPTPLPAASATATQAVTVPIQAPGTIGTVRVLTGGIASADFISVSDGTCAAGNSYPAAATCVITVQFQPKAPGERRGAVVLLDTTGAVMGSQPLYGIGTGGLSVFVPGTITTIAGSGQWVYRPGSDNIPATTSPIFLPEGVAVDPAGNFYIADTTNNRIRRVSGTTGLITTVAGDGTPGYANDGKSASIAEVSAPANLVLDGAGDLYIADSGNHAIRKLVLATGTLTTVAGQLGVQGSSGDGGAATSALLNAPEGIALDPAGNLYIADSGNNAVRKVDATTHRISTYAGKLGVAGFSGDGGPATSATLNTPWGLATDPSSNLYLADLTNSRIRKVSPAGVITTIAGTASNGTSPSGLPATSTNLSNPAAVIADVAGNIYIADSGHDLVLKVTASTGKSNIIAGNGSQSFGGDLGPANRAGIYGPYALALDAGGNLYIADIFHNRIREIFSARGTLLYNATHVGSTSPSQNQTLENDGNAGLQWSAFTAGTNTSLDLANSTCTVGTSLAVDTTCILAAAFSPTVVGGTVTGTIQMASNALNSPGVLTLSGQSTALAPTKVSLSSDTNPSSLNAPVTFTATVTGSSPSGTVQFLDGANVIGTATLNTNGVGTFSISTLSLGSHNITASYGGDVANSPGTSSVLIQAVVQPATVALASSVNPTNVGVSTTLTATVMTAGAVATGTVTFIDGGTTLAKVPLSTSGVASLPISSLTAGTHTIVADYGGDSNTLAAASAPLTQTVNKWNTTLTLTSNVTPSLLGSAVTFTVAVASSSKVAASGSVNLLDGATPIATVTLNAQGSATYTTPNLSLGTHTITAQFAGDPTNAAGTSPGFTEVVVKIPTATAVTSSRNPSSGGGTIQVTAHVTASSTNTVAGSLTGTVIFTEGTTTVGTATLSANGLATANVSGLSIGTHSILASYGGNDGYASSSATLTQVVQLAVSSVQLTSSGSPATVGNNVSITALVTSDGGIPSGTVTFFDGAVNLGQGTLNSAGVVTFSTTALQVGTHSITGSYSGDALNAPSVSPTLVQLILPVGAGDFKLTTNPATVTMASGAYATLTVTMTSVANFTDTLALGCLNLPSYATCTFTKTGAQLQPGGTVTTQLVLDTGLPLGAGPRAALDRPHKPALYEAALGIPAALLLLFCRPLRSRRRWTSLLGALVLLAGAISLTGCGTSLNVSSTPAGAYTVQVIATGSATTVTRTANIALTVQ